MEALVVAPEGVPDPRQRERPDRRADRCEPQVRPERHLENAGRDGDERAHDGRDPAEQDGPAVVPVEPALGPLEPLRTEVQEATVPLDERPASLAPDRPAGDRADDVAESSRERHHQERREARLDLVAEEDDVLRGERTRGECARVDHYQLARGREDRVDRHQHEDGVHAVVADERRDGPGDRREHAPSLRMLYRRMTKAWLRSTGPKAFWAKTLKRYVPR